MLYCTGFVNEIDNMKERNHQNEKSSLNTCYMCFKIKGSFTCSMAASYQRQIVRPIAQSEPIVAG